MNSNWIQNFEMLDQTPTDYKKKDPDSFSMDPENFDSLKKLIKTNSETKYEGAPSPKLRRIGSFSLEDPKPYKLPPLDGLSLPSTFQVAHNLCKSFSKEMKVVNKINHMIAKLDEDLRIQEQLSKKNQLRVDEFFDEVYDIFTKNFAKLTENHKQNLKAKIQQEFIEYRSTHDLMKNYLETLLTNDTFSKILENDMYKVLNSNLLEETNEGLQGQFTKFLQESDDFKFGLTPLVKKFKLIEYLTRHNTEKPILSNHSQSRPISPRLSEMKKTPFKPFVNIQQELETFIANITSAFTHELPSRTHANAPHTYIVEKISKAPSRIYMQDPQLHDRSPTPEPVESEILRKRLSQNDIAVLSNTSDNNISFEDPEKDNSGEKEPKSPKLGGAHSTSSIPNTSASVSLTPIKNLSYKVPKQNKDTVGYFGKEPTEEPDEITFKTHLVSVHYNLSVGDLVVHEGAPFRITHKEWNFPEDTIKMVNIFTGERIEKTYHSRHQKDVDQILTKKYQMVKISEKYGYYLLMEVGWEKSEQPPRLPKVVDFQRVMENIQDEIREAFSTEKRIMVHAIKIGDQERIVSYKKEWF